MEIKTAFTTIIGVLMVVTVIIAVAALMGGLTKISVAECIETGYTTTDTIYRTSNNKPCGTIESHFGREQVYCQRYDTCLDPQKNLCCLSSQSGTGWSVRIINSRCCNITTL